MRHSAKGLNIVGGDSLRWSPVAGIAQWRLSRVKERENDKRYYSCIDSIPVSEDQYRLVEVLSWRFIAVDARRSFEEYRYFQSWYQ